jgi:hypothetical protein
MPAIKNIIGKKYNSLTVIERAENINGRVAWKCICDCNRETIVRTGDLTTGHIKSCGQCNIYDDVQYEYINGYVIGHKKDKMFLIDEEDLIKIKDYGISIFCNGYVSIQKNKESIYLHRFLMNPNDNEVVDHINRLRYDNRKSNLRICSFKENRMNNKLNKNNKSGIIGVYFKNREQKWVAVIDVDGKRTYLGYYYIFEDAVKSRLEGERKYFGEFAPQLHLFKEYNIE